MINKEISIGSLITIGTIIIGAAISYGNNTTAINSINEEKKNIVKKVQTNESDIVGLKIGVAKIETQLDTRFDRLEELLMDIE
tara:strand:- start:910 stop:1158 length:249 start_codon:yes stop_codon:yes gene_type:complete